VVDPIGHGIGLFTEELDPGPLHARVVSRSFDEVQESRDRLIEPSAESLVHEVSAVVKGLVRLGQREHVGVDAGAQVLQRDSQRP
jgi:hypothetical protein